MEMESSRRPFDRSREPGLKKPRLDEDPIGLDRSSNGRNSSFIQRPTTSGTAGSRFRASERGGDSESSDSVRGPYPQTQHQELVNQYRTALAELTFNSKPIITNLTIIAGENLHAAKAIASTVCANIIEVPSEQKLPSLYLLDSIVKNIGRDYIKYFAAKLPEVFCKAYKQVDSSIHPGMRHLFGTWKGVFPLQTLQAIEKELGFVATANGLSSGTSRLDASIPRPAHSIHVNPKYLEARRLQQSTRGKGAAPASDVGGSMVSSSNHLERLEMTPSISSGRTWTDPSVKSTQRPQRDHLSDTVHEKKVNVTYGDSEYDADIVRIGEKFKQDKPWFESGNVLGTISNQKNGFDVKRGFQSYPPLRSANSATSIQPTSNFGSSIGTTESWKNSEEEEFMWEDVNSRLIDHGATNSSGRDHWTPDDSERMSETSADSLSTELRGQAAFGSQLSSSWSKEPNLPDGNRHPMPARNISGYSESYPTSLGALSSAASGRTSFQSKLGPGYGLSTNSALGSIGSIGLQRQTLVGASPSAQSPMHQRPSSPSIALHTTSQVAQHLPELDQPKVRTRSDPRISQFSGSSNVDPRTKFNQDSMQLPPRSAHLANQKLQSPDIHSSSVTQSQLRRPASFTLQLEAEPLTSELSRHLQKPSLPLTSHSSIRTDSFLDDENPLLAQSSGQSSTSSLLAAVMNNGILGGNSVAGSLPHLTSQESTAVTSKANKQLPSAHFSSLGPKITTSLPSQPSSKRPSDTPMLSQRNVEQPTLSPGPPTSSLAGSTSANSSSATNASTSPVSSLLTTLVAKGLISASKMETPASITHQAPAQLVNQSPEIASSSSTQASSTSVSASLSSLAEPSEVPDARSGSKSPALPQTTGSKSPALPLTTGSDIKCQIGFNFRPDVLRELHPVVITELLDDLPHKCNICGLQLKLEEKLARHLEWHDLRNQNKNNLNKASREWYAHSNDWIAGCGGFLSSNESQGIPAGHNKRLECNELMVPADESQCLCILCGELFEDFYDQETDQWMFRGAVYATSPCSDVEGDGSDAVAPSSIIHATCMSAT